MEILEKIKDVVSILDELEDYDNNLSNKQSNVDQSISDVYHYIENNRITSKSGYRICKELKMLLLERRSLKQERSLLDTFSNEKTRLNLKTNRSILLADLHKTQKNFDTEYKYRVYDKDEFAKRMEG